MNSSNLQYCAQCGHLVAKVAPRCPGCGAPPYRLPPKDKRRAPRWAYWTCAAVAALMIIGLLSSPDKTPKTTPPVESAAARPSAAVASPEASEASAPAAPVSLPSSVTAYEPPGLVDIPPEVAANIRSDDNATLHYHGTGPTAKMTCDQYGALAYAITEDRDNGIPRDVELQDETLIKKGINPAFISPTSPSFLNPGSTNRSDIINMVVDIYSGDPKATGGPEDNKKLITKVCENKTRPVPPLHSPARIKGFD